MPIHLTLRPATQEDVPFLLDLRRSTMDEHLRASGGSRSDAYHRARLDYRFDCAQLLLHEGRPVGLLKVVREGPCWEIVQIQLLAELQRKGLGGGLLAQVIADAKAANAGVSLSVLKVNPAKALYERMGFVVVGESGRHYEMQRPA